MFDRVLIVARGEVASRVARSVRRVGSESVGVCFEGEEQGQPHTEDCDVVESVSPSWRDSVSDAWGYQQRLEALGDVDALYAPSPEQRTDPSYARVAELESKRRLALAPLASLEPSVAAIAVPTLSGADTVITAENAADVAAAERALVDAPQAPLLSVIQPPATSYIGPTPEQIVGFRDPYWMMLAAQEAGLRACATSEPTVLQERLAADADAAGFPLHVRRAFGGFDPGRRVASDDELRAYTRAGSEGAWILTKLPERARLLEVYVVANGSTAIAVGEAETSLVREGRVVIAECPAPALENLRRGDAVRASMFEAAVAFVSAIDFVGVGVVHFAMGVHGEFFFDGFSAGLRASHVAVESCANADLVEAELQIAKDRALPTTLLHSELTGNALVAGVDASTDPKTGNPFASRVDELRWPPAPVGRIRVEPGIKLKSKINADDSPRLASVAAYAQTRHEAMLSLDRMLAELRVGPVITNARFLRKVLNHESMRAGVYDADFVERLG